ncbi:MAG: hypothetical protein SPH32_03895 [Erysipelotrichaceae bacterium]|nr:hypothetical protein [Erysipelotrichaceae bacterium]
MINYLLNYVTVMLAIILLISIIVILVKKHQTLSNNAKVLLFIALTILLAYLLCIGWLSYAFANDIPHASPIPISP